MKKETKNFLENYVSSLIRFWLIAVAAVTAISCFVFFITFLEMMNHFGSDEKAVVYGAILLLGCVAPIALAIYLAISKISAKYKYIARAISNREFEPESED